MVVSSVCSLPRRRRCGRHGHRYRRFSPAARSAAAALPLTAKAFQETITIPGAPGNTGDAERDKVLTDMIGVRANYVEVMGMRLLAGRTFTDARQNGVTEAIIDTAIARRFFPGSH